MRRAPALFVVVGVVAGLSGLPVQAQQAQTTPGFWVSLAAGTAGGSSTPGYSEFWFDSPHAPPISISQVTGAGPTGRLGSWAKTQPPSPSETDTGGFGIDGGARDLALCAREIAAVMGIAA